MATLECHARLGSTNARAAQLDVLPALVACEHQQAGRGRRGRVWLSERDQALTFSIAVPLTVAATGLSLAVAASVAAGLRDCGYAVKLKWPNDFIGPGGGKLGGLLVELLDGARRVICGLGINLTASASFRQQLPHAEALDEQGAAPDRTELLLVLAPRMLAAIEQWQREGSAPGIACWREFSLHRPGEELTATMPDGSRQDLAYEDVSETGELLARSAAGELERIASAEIELEGHLGG